MKANPLVEQEVLNVLTDFWDAYAAKDMARVMAHYAEDPDVLALGTNRDQRPVGPEEIREAYQEDFDTFQCAAIRFTWHSVSAEGSVAWVVAEGDASFDLDDEHIESLARLTAVLARRGSHWRILHTHLSFPADETGAAKPAIAL